MGPDRNSRMPGCDAEQRYLTTTLVSFATQEFRKQQVHLSRSAINIGIDCVICWHDERLRKEPFFQIHGDIFSWRYGFGCYAWKPYIIHRELCRLPDGEFLIYRDVGRKTYPHRFELSLKPLLSWCLDHDGILPGVSVPHYGPNKQWTKRDCFVAMDCDTPVYWDHPQVQATFSIWQKNPKALAFVEEWLMWCEKPEVVTDEPNRLGLPNFDEFTGHRWDQSILTNLVIKHQLDYLEGTEATMPDDGDKDMNNAIDQILQREDRIRRRRLRKRFQVWGNKVGDPTWWDPKKLSDPEWWHRRFQSGATLAGSIRRKLSYPNSKRVARFSDPDAQRRTANRQRIEDPARR
jgi:hypothetical protein